MGAKRIVLRYLLFQVPSFLLAAGVLTVLTHLDFISIQAALIGALVWVLKDIILYPIVWRSYDPNGSHSANRLINAIGIAVDPIHPDGHGHVRVHGELWRAKLSPGTPEVSAGSRVRIKEVRILTLIVETEAN